MNTKIINLIADIGLFLCAIFIVLWSELGIAAEILFWPRMDWFMVVTVAILGLTSAFIICHVIDLKNK